MSNEKSIKEYEDAQSVERTTKRYMETFKEIPEMNERMCYFAENGITITFNPNIENHIFTGSILKLKVPNEDPDQLKISEVQAIVTMIDKLITADKFYSGMMDSYNKHPLKENDYLNLLARYCIIKYINKPIYGYIEEKVAEELMLAMMFYTLDKVEEAENEQKQTE